VSRIGILSLLLALTACADAAPSPPPQGTFALRTGVVEAGGGFAEVPVATVTPDFFEWAPAAQMFIGRPFTEAEYEAADSTGGGSMAGTVLILSHASWRDRFGEDPGAVGRSLEVDGHRRTVVGVLTPEATWPPEPEVFVPLSHSR
jgi:putative ABC transport system permease protein